MVPPAENSSLIHVKPFLHQTEEHLKTIFYQHYKGCRFDINNIRDFPQKKSNSYIKLVDVIIKDGNNTKNAKVAAIIKVTDLNQNKQIVRNMTREVTFYIKILPTLVQAKNSYVD